MKKVFISYSYNNHKVHESVIYLEKKLPRLEIEPISFNSGFNSGFNSAFEAGENWQKNITNMIDKCSIFICFIERENPNLMFELGYALAKNKKIILIGEFKDLPFDLRNMAYLQSNVQPYEILMHIEEYLSIEELSHYKSESNYLKYKKNPIDYLKMLIERPDILDSLDPKEFEQLVFEWFTYHKYEVEMTHRYRDYGFDLLVSPFRGYSAAVEIKKYKTTSQVPLTVIRQLVGSMSLNNLSCGILVSTAPFTKTVKYFVNEIEPTIILWTLEDLIEMGGMSHKSIEAYKV